MFGSTVLEVVIGVMFVYLLLSFIVTAVQELIDSTFKLRAAQLARGLQKLLGSKDNKDEFLQHPLIKGMSPTNLLFRSGNRNPSYIPPRSFVLTLLDMIAKADPTKLRTVQDIQDGIKNLKNADLKSALTLLLHDAQMDLAKFEKNVEIWFNDQMDRVTGWYKRKVQLIIVIVALVISVFMNADSLVIIRNISTNSTLRASLVAQAEKVSGATKAESKAGQKPSGDSDDAAVTKEISVRFAAVENSINRVEGLGLPIRFGWWKSLTDDCEKGAQNCRPGNLEGWRSYAFGWWWNGVVKNEDCAKDAKNCRRGDLKYCPTANPKDCKEFLFMAAIPGWLLTAFAISLGAPFWFDMLNKVISIRSTGKAPDEKNKAGTEVK